ncbi:MAG TPA: von Willebrand factor type A domain-containing protein [Candidatus Saccharimonadales bacterium]|nr:von Willebrand factor type A domain-containing protein [Candidatus Saccharimonadales bacterium]
MSPDLPPNPREELEAKVTALLLGELSPEEAARMEEMIAKDAELGRLRQQLILTMGLLRESAVLSDSLKLSAARREKLLARFKTITPEEFVQPFRPKISWRIPVAAAAALALLAVVVIPNFTRVRTASQENSIVNNLRLLDSAKQQWAMEQHKSPRAVPTMKELKPYGGRGRDGGFAPVAGETYRLGTVGEPSMAQVKDKSGKETIITVDEAADRSSSELTVLAAPSAAVPAPPPDELVLRSAEVPPPAQAPAGRFPGRTIAGNAGAFSRSAAAVRSYDFDSMKKDEGVELETAASGKSVANRNSGIGIQGRTSPKNIQADVPLANSVLPALVPQPEVLTRDNSFSTFSLNVGDVAFRLAAASLQNGVMPDGASMRSEEFINAFDYRDPEPAPGAPIGFTSERAGDPFTHNRDLLRFSLKTAAQGRVAGRPLNLVLLLDKSGSMERADRVEIISQALQVLATQLQPRDTLSVVLFARTARLWVDGVSGSQAGGIARDLRGVTPEGGTNLEEAMKLAYATALRHYLAKGENRVVLLTDGAANLGSVDPMALKEKVAANRKQGIALDCFGVGWDGYNDNLLETLSRAGNGRYGFINTPEEAATDFAGKLAGALRVAAADVKVQVEFNSNRVTSFRQIGYAKDQLTKEQFRDNSVSAAQIGAAESGNALYTVEINPSGDGPLAVVHVRFRVPGTTDYQEHEWTVPYTGSALALDQASPALRLAATAAAFSEWLASSPYASEVTLDQLLSYLRGVPQVYGADTRPAKLEWMIRQAKSISGK